MRTKEERGPHMMILKSTISQYLLMIKLMTDNYMEGEKWIVIIRLILESIPFKGETRSKDVIYGPAKIRLYLE